MKPGKQLGQERIRIRIFYLKAGLKDPHHFNADQDPAFHTNADPDPAFHLNADPDPAPFQSDGICYHCSVDLPGLHFEPTKTPLWASTALHGSIFGCKGFEF
jgi:hypothetical protein